MAEKVEPFLKWAGGKRRLLDQLLPHFPDLKGSATYFEPFLGGAAVFFGLAPRRAVLSDVNPALIETFIAVRDNVDGVISHLRRLRHTRQEFYRVRASRPRTPESRAARFIYLNKTCFNGLYRENLAGDFNVPFGRHSARLVVCDAAQLRAASCALANALLQHGDFEQQLDGAMPGDIVYIDPPYIVSHTENGFVEYNARIFSWEDQKRLAAVATDLVKRGCHVLVSNADHASVRRLYARSSLFTPFRVSRWSTMAGASHRRFPTTELLLVGN
ncbi:MAG TPA: Dam family site-specific DNA-(adenine-N6)-methyltransferase [Actinomycetota bacterium]|nr:Dam family site-specific DNA-(adenine-N6)-methyltransferase [Actinomycetota bacterium]